MKIKLTYFTLYGLHFGEADAEVKHDLTWQIQVVVEDWLIKRELPNLNRGHGPLIVLVTVPARAPMLVIPYQNVSMLIK